MNPSYDNSFGSFSTGGVDPNNPSMQQPIMSPQGDIVLSNDKSNSRKKIIIVSIIIVSLIILFIIAVIYFTNQQPFAKNSLRSNFNKLANYALFGNESDSNIDSEYNLDDVYFFSASQQTQEEQEVLFENTDRLLTEFLNTYNSINNKDSLSYNNDILESTVKDTGNLFDFMEIVYTKKAPMTEDILEAYVRNKDEARGELQSYYDVSSESENLYIADFSTDYDNWISAEIDYINFFQSNQCFNNVPDYFCMQQKGEEVITRMTELRQSANDLRQSVFEYYNLSTDFVQNIFIIDALFNNKELNNLITTDVEGENVQENS